MTTTFTMSQYGNKDRIIEAMQEHINALEAQLAEPHPLHQHLLHMLGAKSHEDAGAIIAKLHACELAAVQQGVQQEKPFAVLTREIGESSWWDHKPVKPDSVQHMHAKRDPHYDYVELYTHPTQQGLDAAVLEALQAALVCMEEDAVAIEAEFGSGRELAELDAAGLLDPAIIKVRKVLTAQAKQGGASHG